MHDFWFILQGAQITLILWAVVLLISLPLSLLIVYLYWISPTFFKKGVDVYTWVMRGTPLLLQLFFIYYGLGIVQITLSPLQAAIVAFSLNYTAYFVVIFSNSFFTLAHGQIEAGRALGMSKKKVFTHILLRQAVRQSIDVLSSEALNLIKDTALVASIGMADLLRNSKEIVSRDITIIPFIYAFILYLCFSAIIVLCFKMLKKHYYSY